MLSFVCFDTLHSSFCFPLYRQYHGYCNSIATERVTERESKIEKKKHFEYTLASTKINVLCLLLIWFSTFLFSLFYVFFFELQIAIKGMRHTEKKKRASKQTTKTLTQCRIFCCCCCYCNVQKLFTSDQTALIYKIKQTNLHHKFIAEQYRHIDGHPSNQQ